MDTKTEPAYYVDQAKRQVEIPTDLIALRRQWVAAADRHKRLVESGDTSDEAIDQRGWLRDEMRTLTLAIREHGWWRGVDSAYKAERALIAAAG